MKLRERPDRHRVALCLFGFLSLYAVLALRAWQLQMVSDRRVAPRERAA